MQWIIYDILHLPANDILLESGVILSPMISGCAAVASTILFLRFIRGVFRHTPARHTAWHLLLGNCRCHVNIFMQKCWWCTFGLLVRLRRAYRHAGYNISAIRYTGQRQVPGAHYFAPTEHSDLWYYASAKLPLGRLYDIPTNLRVQLLCVRGHRKTVSRRLAQSAMLMSLSQCQRSQRQQRCCSHNGNTSPHWHTRLDDIKRERCGSVKLSNNS